MNKEEMEIFFESYGRDHQAFKHRLLQEMKEGEGE